MYSGMTRAQKAAAVRRFIIQQIRNKPKTARELVEAARAKRLLDYGHWGTCDFSPWFKALKDEGKIAVVQRYGQVCKWGVVA